MLRIRFAANAGVAGVQHAALRLMRHIPLTPAHFYTMPGAGKKRQTTSLPN
jgi:hypothetical protein